MSAWWSLPKAIPILLRHVLAYAELAGEDLRAFQRRSVARLFALLVAMLGALFSLALICVAVVAAYWDTPHRLHAIFALLGVFIVVTVIGLLSARPKPAEAEAMFDRVAQEWRKDRVILDRLLDGGEQPAPAAAAEGTSGSRAYSETRPSPGVSPQAPGPHQPPAQPPTWRGAPP